MPVAKFDIHTAPMRQSLYVAITENPHDEIFLRDGTKLSEGLRSVTVESYRAHRAEARIEMDICSERMRGVHPDTRQARIASATMGNVSQACYEYRIIMRYLGLDEG